MEQQGQSNIRLIKGDNIEVMDELIKEGVKVDLTVTSPPYDDIRNYNNSLEWNFDVFKKVAQRLYNITADGGVVVWVVGDKTKNGSESGTSFRQALYFKEIGFKLYDTMIYQKESMPLTHRRYEQHFEYMFILVKGKLKTFNPIKVKSKNEGQKNTSASIRKDGENLKTIKPYIVKEYKIKGNVWFYNVGYMKVTSDKEAYKHPAIFPEQLAHDHIISWSNEGDIVFDCFMGSGTTGKMAKLLNRKFIGIEKVENYFEIAKKRIEEA